eukprot:1352487-Amorphochlora_amoeboformis.AAC.1
MAIFRTLSHVSPPHNISPQTIALSSIGKIRAVSTSAHAMRTTLACSTSHESLCPGVASTYIVLTTKCGEREMRSENPICLPRPQFRIGTGERAEG